ncbi:thiolase family protein [Sandaracinobacter neustonicus]|uniref:propanoyl-CoA C-acyltransferase n=1 Tax=Sandaracinobacter neustonicus TaxID=1715348 RepID=A0A501XIX0_9SPHN|nr:thiolase family protein [Sandaracinobacter neustonicus]TPE60486.1 thiolase family protein [Sandaracinobacter neustonicus]
MGPVYLIGSHMTAFGKRPDMSFKALANEALEGVLADAGFADGNMIDSIWFANSAMGAVGQGSIRGQVSLSDAFADGRLRIGTPVVNVENACASSSTALNGAWKDILSGQSRCVLAMGLEKLFDPAPADDAAKAKALGGFMAGADMLEPRNWIDYYKAVGRDLGVPFEIGPGRSPFMDTYAMQAIWHMRHHGSTAWQLAAAASKAHGLGALNPNAQYRFKLTPDEVLADRPVSGPLTRAMCAPIGDGASAALLVSADMLRGLDRRVRERAVRIRASVLEGGSYRRPDEPGCLERAAQRAFAQAGLSARDIGVVELHDATSFGEIHIPESLGLCAKGAAGPLAEAGETGLHGRLPINPSGGLVSRGHPVAATGLAMIHELTSQLRGEAGPRQVPDPRIALAQNGGGVMGFDEAITSVTLLEAA